MLHGRLRIAAAMRPQFNRQALMTEGVVHPISKFLGWLGLALGSYLLGVSVSGLLALVGVTHFNNDHRAEWGPLIDPIVALLGLSACYFGYRHLTKQGIQTKAILWVAIGLSLLAFCMITWRFSVVT